MDNFSANAERNRENGVAETPPSFPLGQADFDALLAVFQQLLKWDLEPLHERASLISEFDGDKNENNEK